MLLIERLVERKEDMRIVLTLFTSRGMKVAREDVPETVELFYLPLDVPLILRNAFRTFNPAVLVITETELWPNLLKASFERYVPVLIANGRLSDRGIRKYMALKSLFSPLVGEIEFIHTQSSIDAERFVQLGASKESVHSGGNIKSGGVLSNLRKFDRQSLIEELGLKDDVKIVVCGSTREGEEEIVLDAFRHAKQTHPDLKLMLAPRHTVRAGEVVRLIQEYGYVAVERSRFSSGDIPDWDVVILDTIGELWKMYGLGICAFVGGSLVPIGGHNPLEPIALGVPTCFGPYMENARELADMCLAHQLASKVHDSDDLADFIDKCMAGEISIPSAEDASALFGSDVDLIADKILTLREASRG
jgi:3-deoxy-D-manno-octulosonic-acid transferase